MARQLVDINTSGELTDIKLGGVATKDSVATKEYTDATKDSRLYTPLVTPPSHLEGKIFYCDNEHSLCVYNDIAATTLNVGQELYIRVINNSGVTIPNGTACRPNGVDVSVQLPQAVPALADTFEHARVLGVATHEILPGDQGFLTSFGKVREIDTSAYTVGQPMYLSDIVPGSYTSIAPDIVTQVGGVLLSSALDGSAQVNIINHIALPTLFGLLQTIPDTFILPGAATWEDLDNYQVDANVSMTVDKLTGRMTLGNDGWYRWTFSTTVTVDAASPGGDDILFRLYNVTQATVSAATQLTVDSTILTAARSATIPFQANAGDIVVVQISSLDSSANLTFDDVSFDTESITLT